MQLDPSLKKELFTAIKNAIENEYSFPLEFQSSGKINHLIANEQQASGYLIDTIEWNDKDYLIYLI